MTSDKRDLRKELERVEKELLELQIRESNHDNTELEEALEEHKYEESYHSLYHYLSHSWKIFERNEFLPANHLHAVSEHLDACLNGQIRRLIINIFPRGGKSALVNKAFPTYAWIKKPQLRFANVSYSADLALEGGIDSKKIINSDWYQRGLNTVWKDLNGDNDTWEISKEHRNLQNDYYNTRNGRRFSTSTEGTFTGKGADGIIIDDPLNPKLAHSKIERDNCIRWAKDTLSSRLDNKSEGFVILVMQRLHDMDLTQHFLDLGNWEHLNIPMEWEESRRIWTCIGWTDWRTKEGESVEPIRFPKEVIEEIKLESGEYTYASQYQQNPAPLGGGLIKDVWWQTYYIRPQWFDSTCLMFDLSFKGDVNSDNNAMIAVGRKDNKFYVLDLVYGKMDIVAQLEAIQALCEKHPYIRFKGIEDKANGSAAWSLLNRSITGLNKVDPKGIAKEVRIMSMVPEINAGNVFLPDPEVCPWIRPLITEAKMFPKGKNDDALDVLAYAIDYLVGSNNFTRLPAEVITESKDVIPRSEIREYFQDTDYATPIQITRNMIQGLFN